MHTLISPFILEAYLRQEFEGCFSAASLAVDVVGFTVLTEALAEHGTAGSEALADAMSALFEPLVESIHAQGGFITHFAGDGFTALFPDQDALAYRRALAAAWSMRQQLVAHPDYVTPYGTFTLGVRIGVAGGEVTWGILPAGEGLPYASYFSGPAIEECANAEQQAGYSEIILSDRAAAEFQACFIGERVECGCRVNAVLGDLPAPIPPATGDLAALSAAAARFLPPAVGHLSGRGEYRNVVAVFLGLKNVDRREELAPFMQVVFDLQRRHGGFLSRIDFGTQGCRVLLFWGAPVGHESDVEQALSFILDLRDAAPRPFRAAITYRVTYAGLVGAAQRADYVCYAQGTNLAARMAQAAGWGDIWLDEATARRGRDPAARGRRALHHRADRRAQLQGLRG